MFETNTLLLFPSIYPCACDITQNMIVNSLLFHTSTGWFIDGLSVSSGSWWNSKFLYLLRAYSSRISNLRCSWLFLGLLTDGLVQDCSNTIANALESLQSCSHHWHTVIVEYESILHSQHYIHGPLGQRNARLCPHEPSLTIQSWWSAFFSTSLVPHYQQCYVYTEIVFAVLGGLLMAPHAP